MARREDDAARVRELERAAQLLRRHCVEMTSAAGSGHPSSCLSAADLVAVLFFDTLRFDVANPRDPRNDRFVLSKGHAAPLLYAAWAEAGALPVARLASLRRIDSELEGHPTPRFPWAEGATGSLGQGLSMGVGMALANRLGGSAARVYVLLGDGELAEGAVWEAAAFAGHETLDDLVAIADVNRLGQTGPTALGHDVKGHAQRFAAFGWHPIAIDGHDVAQIRAAYAEARRVRGRPVAILARTFKGRGVSFLEDQPGWHGKPIEPGDRLDEALAELSIPDPRPALSVRPPEGPTPDRPRAADPASLPPPAYDANGEAATRSAFGTALAKLGAVDPRVVVLDGDVQDSTRTKRFAERYPERFVQGHIAEQNLVGMAVGLAARGYVPWVATFAAFLTRACDQIRMAGIAGANLKLCGSHAGVSIGPDGPSQMGLEDVAMMRAVPGVLVLHPCDAVSTERLVAVAMQHRGIAYLRTLRPETPLVYPADERFEPGGCKVLRSHASDRLTVVAAGVTVHEALRARDELERSGVHVRVVDLYSIEPLDADALLAAARASGGRLLTVEDHYPAGGLGEAVAAAMAPHADVAVRSLAVRELPRSGRPEELLARHGIDAHAIAEAARRWLDEEAVQRS